MTRHFILLLCFLSLFFQARSQDRSLDSLAQKLGDELMKQPQSVGLSIGVYQQGKSHFYNFGTIEKGEVQRPTEHTLYEIGSITKTFASYMLAKAVLEKKIGLNEDIRKYLVGDYPNLQYASQPIRVIHLANTTSALPEWIPGEPDILKKASPDSSGFIRNQVYGKMTRDDFFKALHEVKPDTVPGTKRRHSNGGSQLLTYLLENVYKKPFEELVREHILDANGMRETTFFLPQTGTQAIGYNEKGNPAAAFDSPYFRGLAGLKSSTSDLLKYIQVMLNEEDVNAVKAIQRTINVDMASGKVNVAEPGGLVKPDFYSTSMNWFLYEYEKGKTQVWADGGTSGFNAYLVFYPEIKAGVVVLANKSDEKTFGALPGIAYQLYQVLGRK